MPFEFILLYWSRFLLLWTQKPNKQTKVYFHMNFLESLTKKRFSMQIQKKCFVSEEQGRTMDFAFHLKYSFRSLEWNQEHCRGEGGACGEGRGQCVSEEQCRADQVVVVGGWSSSIHVTRCSTRPSIHPRGHNVTSHISTLRYVTHFLDCLFLSLIKL